MKHEGRILYRWKPYSSEVNMVAFTGASEIIKIIYI